MKQEGDGDRIDSVNCEEEKRMSIVHGLEKEIDELEARSRCENFRFFGM